MTLDEWLTEHHDPKWKPKRATSKPSTKVRSFNRNDVAADMDTYQYTFGFDYRTIREPVTLDEWLDRKTGVRPAKPFKLPTLGKPPALTAKARTDEARRVSEWNKLAPSERANRLEREQRGARAH